MLIEHRVFAGACRAIYFDVPGKSEIIQESFCFGGTVLLSGRHGQLLFCNEGLLHFRQPPGLDVSSQQPFRRIADFNVGFYEIQKGQARNRRTIFCKFHMARLPLLCGGL